MKTISPRAALAGVAVAMLAAAPATADVKIGSLGAITGPIVSLVKEINLAEQAAIDEINAGGGINGDKAVIVFGDTGCNSQTAVDAANKLVNIDPFFPV